MQKILNPNNITQGYADIKPKYNDKLHLPSGMKGYFDYEQGMEVARQIGKPVLMCSSPKALIISVPDA